MHWQENLDAFWRRHFPGSEPVAWQLRDEHHPRWVRFHTLPASKRYPESEAEYDTVLRRHNAVLSSLAEPGERLTLLTSDYSDGPAPPRNNPRLTALDPVAEPWRSIDISDPDWAEDTAHCHVYASQSVWADGVFDAALRLVANDEISNVSIVSVRSGWLYHPYDGGADVILPTPGDRDRLKARFAEWLSPHPGGL